jgi:hypothetical protein
MDLGLVFLGIGSGTNVSGGLALKTATGASGQLRFIYSGSTFRAGDDFFPGVPAAVSLNVQGTISSGVGVLLGLERQRIDANNSGLPKWSVVQSYRTDISGTVALPVPIHLIAPSHFAGLSVDAGTGLLTSGAATEALAVTLRTVDLHDAGKARVIARLCSGNVLASGDYLAVFADA